MNVRYLYGKKEFLLPVIKDKSGLRLSDITHYSRMENQKMRDNEMKKIFEVNRNLFSLTVNGIVINPNEMMTNPVLTLSPEHCYCICFTSRKNDESLYDTFKADICIGFDVDMLKERLEITEEKFPGVELIGKEVTYYHPGTPPDTFTPKELVFYKPATFSHEAEYRLAMFFPKGKKGFKTIDGTVIPFWTEGESTHMTVGHQKKGFISGCVTEVFYRKD
ncbi:hypothetical protein C7431_1114 [Pantoea allii]|uniref:Uncharacterized protein n=1 Tax=Pantoea allii TaxID=574096 RepID=A0A2V2BCT2_9GAMM|nr:hypothetical protein [Pantoea allii]PWK94269.1 hypothetical protein C7431_1114 [Pantoea allii]